MILIITLLAVHFILNPLLGASPWYYGHCILSLYLFANIALHYTAGTLKAPGAVFADLQVPLADHMLVT